MLRGMPLRRVWAATDPGTRCMRRCDAMDEETPHQRLDTQGGAYWACEVTGQLEVAVAARRAVQEELQRLKDEHGQAIAKISDYVAIYGNIEAVAVSSMGGVAPDVAAGDISERSGKAFDPKVVDAFVQALRDETQLARLASGSTSEAGASVS